MKNFTPEKNEKAKTAKNAEELLALAKETGELSDDLLDNVSGGTSGYGGNIPLSNGGEKSFRAVPALNQCPTCGAMYPMNDICPNCVREAPAIEQ